MDSKAIWKSNTFWVNFSALPLLPFLQLVGLDAELSAKITLGVNMAANMVLRLFFVPDEPVAKLSIK